MKKMRTIFQAFLMLLTLGLAAVTTSLRAEDIDIYVDNAGTSGTPNVLFVIDNSSNIASTWGGGGCTGYQGTTTAPSLGTGTAGGVIQCALVDAINSLPNGALNIGLMVGNANNFATDSRPTTNLGWHEVCQGGIGGCLLRKLTLMDANNKASLTNFIKQWKKDNSGGSDSFNVTVNSATSGAMMQEAWAYYNGRTGLSGKSYSPSLLQDCQKNFIIYIGNTDKTPANDNDSGTGALSAAGASAALQAKIKETVTFNPAICGSKNITSKPAANNSNDWSENWADEWARLMFSQDAGTSTQEGMQNITTYSIGIIDNNSNQCTADYPALLSKMAEKGGGKNFRVGNASEMAAALASALNEVQAVNSVFSSASLPVSVNAEGSYLNQIFLGMFRPDSSGAPRWLGNLKQYQLIRNSAGNLVMGDACTGTGCPKPAITSGGTGFLAPDAISFWTYKDTTTLPDSVGGFFVNDPKGTPPHGYDLADGEVVEKGGVAQQLRKQNLTATFAGASGTSVNPRRVYTYCPQGPGDATNPCQVDLAHPDNDFSTTNTKIDAASFGSALTIPVSSIVRNGTTATITTVGNHGFRTGSIVTIRNATVPEYNRTQTVTIDPVNPTKFTMDGLPDYPNPVSTIPYTVSVPGAGGTYTITDLKRATSTSTGSNSETVTVTTDIDTPYTVGQTIRISGVTPTNFNGTWTITGKPATNKFTFSIPVYPVSPALNTYTAVHSPRSVAINSIDLAGGTYTVQTAQDHGFHQGQTVTISGSNYKGNTSGYLGTQVITSVTGLRSFTIATPSGNASKSGGSGSVAPSNTGKTVTLKRDGTTAATSATATGAPNNWFANGDKVDITSTGSFPNEGGYLVSSATIRCTGTCNTFQFDITATPPEAATGFGSVSVPGAGATGTIAAGNLRRTGNVASVTGMVTVGGSFVNGATVDISAASGAAPASEAGYVGTFQINCGADTSCSSFTYSPIPLTPAPSVTCCNIQAYSGNTSPDKDVMIRWLRGQDNQGEEKGPGNGVTVRPSVHGDVLHSRPLVINYGDARGIVVFYGSNDGVYRAVNGNQESAITGTVTADTVTSNVTVPAGGELWGLILPEHFQLINRYRANAPELKFPGSFLATAQPKDYFVDGPTGVYQKLKPDNSIDKAIIYLTMRRGGRLIYAIDVTQPLQPKVLWSISQQTTGFEELGQTWSRPRLTLLQNYGTTDGSGQLVRKPVLVFGAGYDPAQDAEPPAGDTMGRGIFVIDALTGAKVFSASASCPGSTANCRQVAAMKYATPSDIAFVDRDLDGFTDKFYWGDLGGNLWRADVSLATVGDWKITRVAQLGCNTGECAAGATPRKFFFPPAVLSVRAAGAPQSYDALSIVSGDREHPLRDEANTFSAYHVQDRFFMIKDVNTTVMTATPPGSVTENVTASDTDLFNATYVTYDGTKHGFYINFVGAGWDDATNKPDASKTATLGEKGVNAPVAVNGQIFFSTNQPKDKTNTCVANLGAARAYAISPFTGGITRNELSGGGLPPSAVTGLITITETDANGNETTSQEKFCIGCGMSGTQAGGTNTAPCTSALENCNIGTVIPKNLKRTYWYRK